MGQPHVIIIGAGLSGLAIAQGLKKNGISYVVLDRETAPRDRNWGVTISWSHKSLLKLIPEDLYARLPETQPDPSLDSKVAKCEGVLLKNGETGKTVIEPHFPGIRRMNIQKTKNLWSQNVNVKFGKRLSDITVGVDGVVAKFEDGTEEAGTIIVGADGGASVVRKWLLGAAATPQTLPYVFMNFPVKYSAEQALFLESKMHPIVDVGMHPNHMYIGFFMLDKADIARPETWVFYMLVTWPIETEDDKKNSPNRLERVRARMGDWAEPFRSAIAWTPDDTVIKADELKIWQTTKWDNHQGRVTLSGDAAHSMTFHRGQGGNCAFRDSECFVDAMIKIRDDQVSVQSAIEEYDSGVLERGATEVELSRIQTDATHDVFNYLKSPIATLGINPSTKA